MFKAKQIVENKFWILETESGDRVGTVAVRGDKVTAVIEDKPDQSVVVDRGRLGIECTAHE